MKRIRSLLAGAALTGLLIFPQQLAVAMTVQPVILNLTLSGSGMAQLITVENTFATPLPVELRVQSLDFDQNGIKETGKDPGDLLIFPPQAMIQPGQTQSFRVQYVGDPDLKTSKHYYVTVAQRPRNHERHRHQTIAVFTEITGGRPSAIIDHCSPSSAEANSLPPRVPK